MQFAIEVRPATNPESGELGVLLQLPHSFVVLKAQDARDVADMLMLTALEVDNA